MTRFWSKFSSLVETDVRSAKDAVSTFSQANLGHQKWLDITTYTGGNSCSTNSA